MGFKTFGLITLFTVLLLVLVGGIVRSTGSGMGCPDWPKCFGMWIPPTDIKELPLNYQEIYGAKLKGEVVFNATKTWIEYLNRILGVLTGFFVLITAVLSIKYFKKNSLITIFAVSSLILTIIQGGIGAKVVSTELAHSMIHIHLVIAILIVFLLTFSLLEYDLNYFKELSTSFSGLGLLLLCLVLTIIQMFFGTQVRAIIDDLAKSMGENLRSNWVDHIGWKFYFHRSFSILLLVSNFLMAKKLFGSGGVFVKQGYLLFGLIIAEVFTGILFNYFGFPAFAQPLHLFFAVLIITFQAALVYTSVRLKRIKLN